MKLKEALRILFQKSSVVFITGEWKSGKTDFALFLAQLLLRLGLIKKIATNIRTDNPAFTFIDNYPALKKWLYADHEPKLVILDEAAIHVHKRRAMSKLNVMLLKLLPEISKSRARLIFITHSLNVIDSGLLDPIWYRGEIQKITLKTAVIRSPLLPGGEMHLFNIPRTTVKFDPYEFAPFKLEPEKSPFGQETLTILWRYAQGESAKKIGIHHEKLRRLIRKFLKIQLVKILEANKEQEIAEQLKED